jgi:hypothetical protein
MKLLVNWIGCVQTDTDRPTRVARNEVQVHAAAAAVPGSSRARAGRHGDEAPLEGLRERPEPRVALEH